MAVICLSFVVLFCFLMSKAVYTPKDTRMSWNRLLPAFGDGSDICLTWYHMISVMWYPQITRIMDTIMLVILLRTLYLSHWNRLDHNTKVKFCFLVSLIGARYSIGQTQPWTLPATNICVCVWISRLQCCLLCFSYIFYVCSSLSVTTSPLGSRRSLKLR